MQTNIFMENTCQFPKLFKFSNKLVCAFEKYFKRILIVQTLNTISAEKNSTIVFPLPIDMLTYFMKASAAKK